jgi:putative flippase GtrA
VGDHDDHQEHSGIHFPPHQIMSRRSVATFYATFAAASIAINIGAQAVTSKIYKGPYSVTASILVGTGAGLTFKYILDKSYIFEHTSKNGAHETATFIKYCFMGILTTGIFLATETLFHYWFHEGYMRYVGGLIGLIFGYIAKYWLDRRFVFS